MKVINEDSQMQTNISGMQTFQIEANATMFKILSADIYQDKIAAVIRELSTNAIDQIVRELSSPGLNEGLLIANERIYEKLCLGITVTEFVEGKKVQPTIHIIDWKNPDNNHFQVTEELEVLSTNGTHTRRPDIVCYVNGFPLVVIEAKRPDMEEALASKKYLEKLLE